MKHHILLRYIAPLSVLSMHAADVGNMHLVRHLVNTYAERARLEHKTPATVYMTDDIETPLLDDNKRQQRTSYTQHATPKNFAVKAHGEHALYNATLLSYMGKKLATHTPLPTVVGNLVTDYLQPGWQLATIIHTKPGGIVSRLQLYDDRVASCTEDSKGGAPRYELWDIPSQTLVKPSLSSERLERTPRGFGRINTALDFDYSSNGTKRMVCDQQQGIILWDAPLRLSQAERRGEVKYIQPGPVPDAPTLPNTFLSARFTPSNNHIVAGQLDGTVTILNAQNGKRIYTFAHPDSVTALYIAHNTVLAGLANGTIAIWRNDFEHPALPREALPIVETKQVLQQQESEPLLIVDAPPPSRADLCQMHCEQCNVHCIMCEYECFNCVLNGVLCCLYTPGCCIESCQNCRQKCC